MRIRTLSVPVLDQEKAFRFYTEKLGFQVRHDIPMGGEDRWLTVVSPEEPDGPEVLLEPAPRDFEPAKVFQKALYDAGIPWTQFEVDDVDAEYKRLLDLGVQFKTAPKDMGTVKMTVLHDTCGNHIALIQML